MNIFKQLFVAKRDLAANTLKSIFKNSSSGESIHSRCPVRTPLSIDINKCLDKSSSQSSGISRNVSNNFIINRLQNLLPKSTLSSFMHRELHETSTLKKRPGFRKKRTEHQEKMAKDGYFTATAFATAEEYDLEKLVIALKAQDLYEPKKFFSSDDNNENEPDVLFATAKSQYQVGNEPRGIYFFREGTVVMWNCSDMESSNILLFLKDFEQDSYDEKIVQNESEVMFYNYAKEHQQASLRQNNFYITKTEETNILEKYTFSNAMSLSVKLGIWEASLDAYVDSMAYVTEDLKEGNKFKITRPEMLRKTGELFALRHLINLSSDLLDTPDFYWDRDQLEILYNQTNSYFSISKRTRVMNEKLNHCVELADLITSNLNDIHHVRLEKIIIYLIMIEVCFEIVHYVERYYGS